MLQTEPGSQIDQYLVEEVIARTGTASIVRATDQRDGRQIVLKAPHMEVAGDPLFYQRFVREQEICENLDHPGVVRAAARKSPHQKYIVMDLAPGRMLRRVLNEAGTLPQERAVKIAVAICEALDYVHEKGVVHRDLKPENIMIDGEDRITLVDFGIASREGARRLTFGKLSHVMGSPDYIAPEQIKGKRGDPRTDVYAVGVMLYEMLTGETPFSGDNPFVVMNRRLVSDPVPAREINPNITPELDAVVQRAMARNPEDRYASARNLSSDLQHPERVQFRSLPSAKSPRARLARVRLRLAEFWR